MTRTMFTSVLAIVVLTVCMPPSNRAAGRAATVRLEVVDFLGGNLGTAEIKSFKNMHTSEDYASRFEGNTVSDIPYGGYHLRANVEGYRSTDRIVYVGKPETWVVVGLSPGSVGGTASLLGKIKNLSSTDEPVWVRISGIRSGTVRDEKVDEAGNFSFTHIEGDVVILVIWSGSDILHTQTVNTIRQNEIVINLLKKK